MDALLILGGLLLILSGLVWLVMRAFSTSLLWGWGSLIPPITLIYVLRHWRTARNAVGLAALGVIPLVVGMVLMATQDAARLEAILSLRWLKEPPAAPAELQIRLYGELNGQPFSPQYAELVDGVLSLREGEDFFARREVKIRLPQTQPKAPVKLDVLPEDEGQLPEVEISWLLPEQDLPEARRLNKGYTLHLDLQVLPPNKLHGDFHLVLPPSFQTGLSGQLELFADRLRYKDGRLDTHFDSRETLTKVVEDHLQRRFATRLVQLAALPEVGFPADRLPLSVQAKVNGSEQRLELVLEKGSRGWQVQGDNYPTLAEARAVETAKPVAATEAAAPVVQVARPALDRRQRFSLPRLQRNPEQYRTLAMRVSKAGGGTVEGRFIGVDTDGSIRLSQQLGVGGGQASFSFKPEEIARIELLEP
ncbi:MFS transporter [Pseudomonas sp. PDM16]|uniref:MFS transporter n=1 Tax=Pseudomonas sp. PDM16 TaxID=2769292 RepID=UPI00177E8E32|nr:MFS transporter [Pseudomonas sp. PDM16]MBD9416227.1 MFS transporter [Pseudomonas sp. PDM16]